MAAFYLINQPSIAISNQSTFTALQFYISNSETYSRKTERVAGWPLCIVLNYGVIKLKDPVLYWISNAQHFTKVNFLALTLNISMPKFPHYHRVLAVGFLQNLERIPYTHTHTHTLLMLKSRAFQRNPSALGWECYNTIPLSSRCGDVSLPL